MPGLTKNTPRARMKPMTPSLTNTKPRAMRAFKRVRKIRSTAKPMTTRAAGRLMTRPGAVKGGPLAQRGRARP